MLNCGIYLAVTGILSFFLGRCLRPERRDWNRFPYLLYACEKDGTIYRKIGIHHWQNKVPDMSKIFPGMMPPKRLVDTGLYFNSMTCTFKRFWYHSKSNRNTRNFGWVGTPSSDKLKYVHSAICPSYFSSKFSTYSALTALSPTGIALKTIPSSVSQINVISSEPRNPNS